jgi:hypothetical protein
MVNVHRLLAHVTLDDPGPALERAAAQAGAGDESWEQRLANYRRGEAIIVRVDVSLEVAGENGPDTIEATDRGVFLKRDAEPPKVEYQVAELVGQDLAPLARELETRNHDLDIGELRGMFVHVELGQDVIRCLTDGHSRRAGSAARHGTAPAQSEVASSHSA